jgi:hypothetical protein
VDLKNIWKVMPHLTWHLLIGVFVPGDGMPRAVGLTDPEVELFVATTLVADF